MLLISHLFFLFYSFLAFAEDTEKAIPLIELPPTKNYYGDSNFKYYDNTKPYAEEVPPSLELKDNSKTNGSKKTILGRKKNNSIAGNSILDESPLSSRSIHTSSKVMDRLIDFIPDKDLKNGLKEYMSIIDPKAYHAHDAIVGGGNMGISAHFSRRFTENQCFKNAARKFYGDIAKTLEKACQKEKFASEDNSISTDFEMKTSLHPGYTHEYSEPTYKYCNERAKISEVAGEGNRAPLKEGWVYELALKHANGNAEAALELIGMCGHDDTSQGNFLFLDTSPDAIRDKQKVLQETIQKLKNKKSKFDAELKELYLEKDEYVKDKIDYLLLMTKDLEHQIAMSSKEAAFVRTTLVCPPADSGFFVAGSLDKKADISDSLKEKIIQVQAKGDKNTKISSKYYHVYGSAFLACKLVTKGVRPSMAVEVQKQAARMYRGIRMCSITSETTKEFKEATQNVSFGLKTIDKKILSLWDDYQQGKINCDFDIYGELISEKIQKKLVQLKNKKKRAKTEEEKTEYAVIINNLESQILSDKKKAIETKPNNKNCVALAYFDLIEFKDAKERDVVIKKIQGRLERVDAAKLYNDWYLGGGKILGQSIPCTDIRLDGPKNLLKPNSGIMGWVSRPLGWGKDRYEAATQRLATWDLDFEWTIAQHKTGAEFGAKACQKNTTKNPFEHLSCQSTEDSALQNSNTGSKASESTTTK